MKKVVTLISLEIQNFEILTSGHSSAGKPEME